MTIGHTDVLVYGGGPAALRAALELARAGCKVALCGPCDAARWPTLATGGIDRGDDPEALFLDTIVGGDYLAPRPPVQAMAHAAADIVDELAAIGVPFTRNGDRLALRRLDGSRTARAAFAETRTTQFVLQALDLVASHAAIARLPHHELVQLVADERGRCAGCVVQDRISMEMIAIAADAVLLALGGSELGFSASHTALASEAALAVAFEAGAVLANMEMVQTAPAAVWLGPLSAESPRGRRARIVSSSLAGEGAIWWLPEGDKDGRLGREVPRAERHAFLEASYRGWGSSLVDDLAAAAVRTHVLEHGLYDRRRGKRQPLAYLDVSHLPEAHLRARLGSELDLYRKLSGADPYRGPLPVHPALSDRLGGLWVDYEASNNGMMLRDSPRNHATSIEGLYACGGAAYLYHGANRLSGNLLLADLFGAERAARAILALREGLEAPGVGADFDAALASSAGAYEEVRRRDGGDAPVALHARLREALHGGAGILRDRESLGALVGELEEIADAVAKASPSDPANSSNRGAPLIRNLERAVELAQATARSALAREESRGVHRRSDHADRLESKPGEPAPRVTAPFLTLTRRDDDGIHVAGELEYELLGTIHPIDARVDEAGIDEQCHPRRYREES